ncbi:hypothetical protein OAF54_01025 [bacterium]|nr:hypothetical protein [bacterium]
MGAVKNYFWDEINAYEMEPYEEARQAECERQAEEADDAEQLEKS